MNRELDECCRRSPKIGELNMEYNEAIEKYDKCHEQEIRDIVEQTREAIEARDKQLVDKLNGLEEFIRENVNRFNSPQELAQAIKKYLEVNDDTIRKDETSR